ncbi:VAO-type flavoprotein oxidase [Cladobotryum mycophilum]|uniref:VAO-type flavoprotein oxidase n=1 Tax=Cladobotryum mycophilum TaxID=491253 RepID=A0ABR0SRG1_9HYPO
MHSAIIIPVLYSWSSAWVAASSYAGTASCRNIPGDAGWPVKNAWDSLNTTVAGRLIATSPAAHVCHDPTFSDAACKSVSQEWDLQPFMTSQPGEILSTWFQNQSCNPFTPRASPCQLGNYASYIINVSSIADITAGLQFSQQNNIRLVIKNSGHDFYGKSTGKGALSLWTRNLNNKQLISAYDSSYYRGPAIKLGAGVTGGDAAKFASQNGYRIVAGSCPTVGLVGGFTQGGGHSFLSGLYGFGADNVLEWEVVLASGEHVVATPTQYQDLYWALSGGGGGTYGVVVSMTVRVFPEGQTAIASLSFNVTTAGGVDKFWGAVGTFLTETKLIVDDHGIVAASGITNDTLGVIGMFAPGLNKTALTSLLKPLISALAKKGISAQAANLVVSDSPSYYALNSSAIVAGIKAATDGGKFTVSAVALNAKGQGRAIAPVASNSVQPAFLDAYLSLIFSATWSLDQPWSDATKLQDKFANSIMPVLEAATPGAGAYNNEANWEQPNFQQTFYGSTYDKLKLIKKIYDPQNVFYGLTAVGSEAWAPDAQGRLCRTGAA